MCPIAVDQQLGQSVRRDDLLLVISVGPLPLSRGLIEPRLSVSEDMVASGRFYGKYESLACSDPGLGALMKFCKEKSSRRSGSVSPRRRRLWCR